MARDSSPLFFPSSSPPHLSVRPSDAVAILVEKAQETQTLSLVVDNFLKSKQNVFFGLFSRQIDLIKSRSQNIQDAEITIFDQALLILTEHPNCLMNPAAVKFYCEEYLNIGLDGPISQLTLTLRETVQIPAALNQVLPSSDTATLVELDVDRFNKTTSRLPPVNGELREDMEPKLAALWSVYESARTEYQTALDKPDKEKKINTAKFLRDTAENILLFLQNKNADALMIAELEGTFMHAKTTVVWMTGGKNRKFDTAEMDKVKGIPRGPSRSTQPQYHQYPPPSEIASQYHNGASAGYEATSFDRSAGRDFRGRTPYPETHLRQNHTTPTYQSTRDRRYSYGESKSSYAVYPSEPLRRRYNSNIENRVRRQSHQVIPDIEYQYDPEYRRYRRSASPAPPIRECFREPREDRRRPLRSRSRSFDSRYQGSSFRDEMLQRKSGRDGDTVTGRSGLSADREAARLPEHGRGPSRLPYGYSHERTVDSYRPARRGSQGEEDESMDDGEVD